MKKILFFANIPTNDEQSIGGATVLANNILHYILDEKGFDITHQQIRRNWNKYGQIFDYFIWVFKAPFVFRKFDIISIHATSDFHLTIAPIIWLWAKLFKKKIIYHFFGGIFFENYKNSFFIHKLIMKNTFLSSHTVFMETKLMIESFNKEGIDNIIWLPNARKESLTYHDETFKKKFVFISRITPTKGVNEILLASNELPNDYQVDIYGPLDSNFYDKEYFNNFNVTYKGVIPSEMILDTLLRYDVLLLPTYHEGEGYPGIIIESLSLGIPIITTKWRALSELISDSNGILIHPKNHNQLLKAMLYFNQFNYISYRKHALCSFNQFSYDFVFRKILNTYIS